MKSKLNKTITYTDKLFKYRKYFINYKKPISKIKNLHKYSGIIWGDYFSIIPNIPDEIFDLVILDPPYNITKLYKNNKFNYMDNEKYQKYFENIIQNLYSKCKSTATIYICSDWKTSLLITPILTKYFFIQNRITWKRDKGRGSKKNYKNNMEDIWFCTISKNKYIFNINNIKIKKDVIAPYKDEKGKNKDWFIDRNGKKYRFTHPSNIWTDLVVPFWSMPENTEHPTQKPEKLIEKLILASSKENNLIFDPFLGSGTTAVVAKRLNRKFIGIEREFEYCCIAQYRINNNI